MRLDEQLEYFDRHFDQAWARRMRTLRDPSYKAQRRITARQRLIESYDLYGDTGWHTTHAELVQSESEEDDDAINYRLFRMSQGWPT